MAVALVMPLMNVTNIMMNDNHMTTADMNMKMKMNMKMQRSLEDTAQDEGPPTKKSRLLCRSDRYSYGKRVHFSQPEQQVHLVPLVDDADMAAVWYSAQELQHFRSCDAHWVRCYKSYCDDVYKQQLFRVLGTACGKQSHSTEMNALVADSPIRGLERDMTPCFRLRKKHVVSNVLASQAALLAWNQKHHPTSKDGKDTTTMMRRLQGEQLLALHYHKLALPATRFARLLAEGDAHVVANMKQ
jgi:hypothetical protein